MYRETWSASTGCDRIRHADVSKLCWVGRPRSPEPGWLSPSRSASRGSRAGGRRAPGAAGGGGSPAAARPRATRHETGAPEEACETLRIPCASASPPGGARPATWPAGSRAGGSPRRRSPSPGPPMDRPCRWPRSHPRRPPASSPPSPTAWKPPVPACSTHGCGAPWPSSAGCWCAWGRCCSSSPAGAPTASSASAASTPMPASGSGWRRARHGRCCAWSAPAAPHRPWRRPGARARSPGRTRRRSWRWCWPRARAAGFRPGSPARLAAPPRGRRRSCARHREPRSGGASGTARPAAPGGPGRSRGCADRCAPQGRAGAEPGADPRPGRGGPPAARCPAAPPTRTCTPITCASAPPGAGTSSRT